jgi:DNA modification methylase
MKTQPGSTVLDPVCGTGTTLIAAMKLGCSKAVGIELDPVRAKLARDRCKYYATKGYDVTEQPQSATAASGKGSK